MWDIVLGFLKPVFGIIDKAVLDKTEAERLKFALQTGLMQGEFQEAAQLIEAQSKIIVAEAQGKGWLQNNWRPLMMTMFGLIVFNNYILFPYIDLFGYKSVMLEIPPDLWGLLKIGIGGYVVGRSAEKIVPGIVTALKAK